MMTERARAVWPASGLCNIVYLGVTMAEGVGAAPLASGR